MKKLTVLVLVLVLVFAIALLPGCTMYKSHNTRVSGRATAITPVALSSPSYQIYDYGQNWRLNGFCHTLDGMRIPCPAVYPQGVRPGSGVILVATPTPNGKTKTSKLTPEKYMGSKVVPPSCKTGDAGKDGGCITAFAEKLGQEQESCAGKRSCPKDYDPARWQKAKEALASLGEELSDE